MFTNNGMMLFVTQPITCNRIKKNNCTNQKGCWYNPFLEHVNHLYSLNIRLNFFYSFHAIVLKKRKIVETFYVFIITSEIFMMIMVNNRLYQRFSRVFDNKKVYTLLS